MEDFYEVEMIDDKYVIMEELSYGGFGFIYLVKKYNNNDKTLYAAKIPKKLSGDFNNEIQILDEIKENNCKYIINKIDSGKGDIILLGEKKIKKNYIILEYVPNRDLGEHILFVKKPFGETFSKVIFYKIAKDIDYLHNKKNICHRDIKLDNIILDGQGNPKIGDFGHAIKYSPELTGHCGTKGYQAPELMEEGDEYDGKKIDIFSLGITLIRLTLGKYRGFYQLNKKNEFYKYIKDNNIKDFWNAFDKDINKSLSPEFKDICFQMISFEPEKRKSIDIILKHDWFGKLRFMSEEELEKYEEDIGLKKELEIRAEYVNNCARAQLKQLKKGDNNLLHKKTTKGINYENNIFSPDAEPEFIKNIKFRNYYIDINNYTNPVKFMNSLCNKIIDDLGENNCAIEENKEKKLKFELTIFGNKDNQNEEEEEEELTMRVILYKTTDRLVLRCLKNEINKNDFIDMFQKITKFAEESIEE